MRYSGIISFETNNGKGIGISLYVQGCHFHCPHCFNPETWDFNGGYEWTKEIEDEFFKLLDHEYYTRVSILGGEPLTKENINDIIYIAKKIKENTNKEIWVFTGYELETIPDKEILQYIDYIITGQYVHNLKNPLLPFRGSENQNIFKVKGGIPCLI